MFDAEGNSHKERRNTFVVSIPGLNDWAVDLERQSANKINDIQIEPHDSSGVKRSLDTATEENVSMDVDETQSHKKSAGEVKADESETKGLSREYQLNSPIVDRPSNACIIKFYEEAPELHLNQVIDVVGFVSVDASLCGTNRKIEEYENANEVCAMNPPPSLIPRIHAITYRSIAHLNPLLHDGRLASHDKRNCEEIIQDVRKVLTQCLFGDSVAAEYLFCHLISTVYVRGDVETLGQFSLNITNFPTNVLATYTKQLYGIIELLLPASHFFPITIDNLNTTDFIPA